VFVTSFTVGFAALLNDKPAELARSSRRSAFDFRPAPSARGPAGVLVRVDKLACHEGLEIVGFCDKPACPLK